MTSVGNNFNNFPENRLTKFRAVYTVIFITTWNVNNISK